jgi:hypothetical protein
VPDCLNEQFIKRDFINAVNKHFSTWATSFRVHGLRDVTLPAKEMFLQFREEAMANHPIRLKLAKAAFAVTGPTLDGEEPDDMLKKGRGRQRKRARLERNTNYSTNKCKACDGPHPLIGCWYTHPEKAPKRWIPRDTILQMVNDRISDSPELQAEVWNLKRPKSRTLAIKLLTSVTLTVEPAAEE